jgi:uncharacterized DUF497 family protein
VLVQAWGFLVPARNRYTIRITARYEWNEEKSRRNRKKHGVTFEAAVRFFNDPFLLLIEDRIVEGEQRWRAIGAVGAAVLLVVHAYRTESERGKEEIIRIISARTAEKSERRRYFDEAAQ